MTTHEDRTIPGTGKGGMKSLAGLLGAALMLALFTATRFSPAQTTMELTRWKEFSYPKRTSQLMGEIAGLTVIDRGGFIVLSDGSFAKLSSTIVHTDSPEGKTFYQGFVMYDFKDGSSILAKVDVSGDRMNKQVGTITFLSGTQRFKGITGRGAVYSWMPADWEIYAEIEASYSVSTK
jgi:hypothetical protein